MSNAWALTKETLMVDYGNSQPVFSLTCFDDNTKEHIHHFGLFKSIDEVNDFCAKTGINFYIAPKQSVRALSHSSGG